MPRCICPIATMSVVAVLAGCGPSHTQPKHAAAAMPEAGSRGVLLPLSSSSTAPTVGRFQIVSGPRDSSGTYLLDTMTGHVWRLVQKRDLEGEPYVWEHMDRLDTNADDYVFRQEHQPAGR